jgi:hypothetical protein
MSKKAITTELVTERCGVYVLTLHIRVDSAWVMCHPTEVADQVVQMSDSNGRPL